MDLATVHQRFQHRLKPLRLPRRLKQVKDTEAAGACHAGQMNQAFGRGMTGAKGPDTDKPGKTVIGKGQTAAHLGLDQIGVMPRRLRRRQHARRKIAAGYRPVAQNAQALAHQPRAASGIKHPIIIDRAGLLGRLGPV